MTGSQKNNELTNEDGSLNSDGLILDAVDTFFTSIFTVELLINMFANWFKRFVLDGWNQLDFIVVSLSLVALGPVSMPINVIRVMRAFRVIRLFGRLKSLKNIVGALTSSILPVMNAFLILLIVASICESSLVLSRSRPSFDPTLLHPPDRRPSSGLTSPAVRNRTAPAASRGCVRVVVVVVCACVCTWWWWWWCVCVCVCVCVRARARARGGGGGR